MFGIGVSELVVIFVYMILLVVLLIVPMWKIFSKAGFSGALSLLMLVPLANIIMLFYLAFAEWPALRKTTTP